MRPESVLRGNNLLYLVDSIRVKELRAPVPDIEKPEKNRACHRYEQETAMMLGQGETSDS